MDVVNMTLLVIVAYLFGSISTAIIVCKLMKLPDPRSEGSHNPGATNVLKIGGEKAAAFTLFGDFLKGLVPVLISVYFGADELTLALVAVAAFFGHLYPLFFNFKGGKGVATAFGVILGLSLPVAVAVLTVWLSVYYFSKISSLSALSTALVSPLLFFYIDGSITYTLMSGLLSAVLIVRHRSNIEKLIDGTED